MPKILLKTTCNNGTFFICLSYKDLYASSECVVDLNKHSTLGMLQVGGTTDNIEECCATFASRALGLETPLKTTHQIDNCTEGWCIFPSYIHGSIY